MTAVRFANEFVRLRALESTDVDALHAYMGDERLFGCRYVPWGTRDIEPFSRGQVQKILDEWGKEKKAFTLGIEVAGAIVGHAGCHWGWDTHCPSVWIVVAPESQRQGIGSGALDLLLTHLFENTPAHNVNGWIASWNKPALAFADAHGFLQSGRIPRGGLRNGSYFDEVMIDILKPEWLARREVSHGA